MQRALSQIHELISDEASRRPSAPALTAEGLTLCYGELSDACGRFAAALLKHGLKPGERVGVYLPKTVETVVALFGTSVAGGTFVPINPVLRPPQVAHIIGDCGIKTLITSQRRLEELSGSVDGKQSLKRIVVIDALEESNPVNQPWPVFHWKKFLSNKPIVGHRRIDADMAAIFYTSGSTGQPKGVVLSHRNLLAGAECVSNYLSNTSEDRLLAVLPLSFDAGLSQLTTAFNTGAEVVLLDYLLPQDVVRAIEKHKISGLAGVPTLWNKLANRLEETSAGHSLRYITNTGGPMPASTLAALRQALPNTKVFLMYGLTEAFRSTYLDPAELDRRPTSIGKAVPNAELHVVDENGNECPADVPGELVHRGNLVAMGYWNDPEATRLRFKPWPRSDPAIPGDEVAVWSGDLVRRDAEGFLYFVARDNDLIKTSEYRVSPTEIEEVAYSLNFVAEAVAIGVPHSELGQAIVLILRTEEDAGQGTEEAEKTVVAHFKHVVPSHMQPRHVTFLQAIPENQNGKPDRGALRREYHHLFVEASELGTST